MQGGLAIRIAYVAAAPAVAVGMAVSFAFAAFCGNAQGYAVLACTGGNACGGIVVLVVVVFVMFFAGGVEVNLVFGFEVGTHFARYVRAGDIDVRLRACALCLQVNFAACVDGARGEGTADEAGEAADVEAADVLFVGVFLFGVSARGEDCCQYRNPQDRTHCS